MGATPRNPSRERPAGGWPCAGPGALVVPAHGVLVVALDLDAPAADLDRLATTLDADERHRAARLSDERARARFVARRGLVREVLAAVVGTAPARLAFAAGPHGKPRLVAPAADVGFNVSHRDGRALLAVARGQELGVDLERARPLPEAVEVAHRFFSAEEAARLAALPVLERERAFFGLWTRKEAVGKHAGDGVGHDFAAFTLPPDDVAARGAVVRDGAGHPVWVGSLPPPCPGFLAALACAVAPESVTCVTLGGEG